MKNLLLPILFALSAPVQAQMPQSPWISWEDFLYEYADLATPSDDASQSVQPLLQEEMDALEYLVLHPLQVNSASREDLLQLPFLDQTQADSILAYREHRRGFLSIGELSLVNGLDFTARRWLSLFVRCDSLQQHASQSLSKPYRQRWHSGHHELASRMDIPLYRRQGFKDQERNTETNRFMGSPLRHLVRYRYDEKRETQWGLTFEKDAGEPAGKQGFYPYDHISGYVCLRPKDRNWNCSIGDFEVYGGRGLVWGRPLFGGREQLAGRMPTTATTFRPHTSSSESGYFRGAAASVRFRAVSMLAFASYRKLDARMDADTARTVLTTGLHRTMSEIQRRRTLGCLTSGVSIGWQKGKGCISVNGNYSRYAHPLWPEQRRYNKDYFRGTVAVNASAAYGYRFGLWNIGGELAVNGQGRLATEHVIAFSPATRIKASLQLRHFDPRYTSPYGHALQQGSRVTNEDGVMLGLYWRPQTDWTICSYIDFFQFIHPTYTTILPHAKGMEWSLRTTKEWGQRHTFSLRYRLKTRQYTITAHELMEYRTTHRLSAANTFSFGKCQMNAAAHVTFAARQTGQHDWGEMLSTRITCRHSRRWQTKGLFAWFHTSDYASAVYAYEPDVLQTGFSSAFAHHGIHLLLLADCKLTDWAEVAVKCASTRYFDLRTQSSGVMAIHSPWKNDVSLLLRLKL